MRRPILILIALLAVQLLLALGLAIRTSPLAGVAPESPLLGTLVANADELVIDSRTTAEGSTTAAAPTRIELARHNGEWVMPSEFNIPIKGTKVYDLLARLATLRRGLPIATSGAALERFKLADDDFEHRVVLKRGGKTLGTLYLGSSSGVRQTDARTASERAVYAIDLASYELPAQASDWFDADLLQHNPASLTELQVTHPHDMLTLVRQSAPAAPASAPKSAASSNTAPPAPPVSPIAQPAMWIDSTLPAGQHLNNANADSLAQAAAQVVVSGVLGTAPKPEWQQEHPALALTLKDNTGHTESWTVSQPTSGDFYVLKSSAQPWYFSLSSGTGKQLLDASARSTLLADSTAPAAPHATANHATSPKSRVGAPTH
jgi:Domain of unknown function (DUF4340)